MPQADSTKIPASPVLILPIPASPSAITASPIPLASGFSEQELIFFTPTPLSRPTFPPYP